MSQELRKRIQDARQALGETQSKFAVRLGVPVRTLMKWEQDQATPRGLALEALNAKLDEILGSGK